MPELYKPEHQEIYDELGANDDEEHQAETPGNCFAFLYREYIGSEKKIDTFSWETIKTSQNYKRWARGLTKGSNAPLKETGSQVVMLAAIKAMGDEVLQEMAEVGAVVGETFQACANFFFASSATDTPILPR